MMSRKIDEIIKLDINFEKCLNKIYEIKPIINIKVVLIDSTRILLENPYIKQNDNFLAHELFLRNYFYTLDECNSFVSLYLYLRDKLGIYNLFEMKRFINYLNYHSNNNAKGIRGWNKILMYLSGKRFLIPTLWLVVTVIGFVITVKSNSVNISNNIISFIFTAAPIAIMYFIRWVKRDWTLLPTFLFFFITYLYDNTYAYFYLSILVLNYFYDWYLEPKYWSDLKIDLQTEIESLAIDDATNTIVGDMYKNIYYLDNDLLNPNLLKRIRKKNRIIFHNEQDAINKGYTRYLNNKIEPIKKKLFLLHKRLYSFYKKQNEYDKALKELKISDLYL